MKQPVPRNQVSNLSTKMTKSIGIIASHLREPLISDILENLFEQFNKLDVDIYLRFHSEKEKDISVTINNLLSLDVGTIIIFSSFFKINSKELEKVRSAGKKILFINSHSGYNGFSSIEFDLHSTYQSIINEILVEEEKFIAMLAGNNGIDTGAEQLAQLTSVLSNSKISSDKRFFVNCDVQTNALPVLLEKNCDVNKGGVVLVANKELLGKVLRFVHKKEKEEIFQHIKFVVLQYFKEIQYFDFPVASINYPVDDIVKFVYHFHLSEDLDHDKMIVVPSLCLSK